MRKSIQVDVFHDTVCPWCRIGKRHLELALGEWGGVPVSVNYRAFFLNPDIPPEGYDFRAYMLAKGGGQIPLEQFFTGPREMGAQVGLTFNFEAITRAPNSMLSHRLIYLAPAAQQESVIDALYSAYFEHGQDIGRLETLMSIAAGQSLDVAVLREKLEGDAGLDAVTADVAWAREHGITGVPFFVLNGRYAFSGAQPPHFISGVLQQAADE
jgi:predicted DsbA family dithiol-disulfide isomerase